MDNKAMYKLGYGLYVLTARDDKDNGCIVNTVMQITSAPNRIIAGVNKLNKTHNMISKTHKFNISVLSVHADFDLFRHFGYQSGADIDKFEGYDKAERSQNGIFYITEGTNAFFQAEVVEMVDCGTHTLFIADVKDAKVMNQEASVTYEYYQEHIKPKPKREEGQKRGYRCKICGYTYEGDELPQDFVCPVCKHGADDFEKIQ